MAFTVEMAKRALVIVLREETEYLQRYDTLLKVVNDNYDVRGSLLSKLIMQCLDQNGVVSKGRRKQYNGYIQEEVFDFLEGHAQALLAETHAETDDQ